ncbi:AraC family transcriptional regulator [Pseudovibrio ascidiaceicola]|uniref:AraC family transcriptional regulator n=1 Tax=Pseudovibrio ascidiaceicola TaxID=285279 RepID=UPI000D699FCB|nr:AraC family transcriptional regulator [Pseudovibrio ascidiaceicola]
MPIPKQDWFRFAADLSALAPTDGLMQTALPCVTVYRASKPGTIIQAVYQPNLCIVAQGQKAIIFGNKELLYDPLNYLAVTMPLPLEGRVIQATEEEPFLALLIDIDLTTLSHLLVELGDNLAIPTQEKIEPAIYISHVKQPFLHAVLQLLSIMKDPVDCRILAPGILKSIIYYALQAEHHNSLQAMLRGNSATYRISRVVRFLDENYSKALDLKTIAAKANMSESSLSHNFKAITSMSPIQYIKKIRLHRARLLMLGDGLNASDAAFNVGYSSPSQFSREFQRMFGASPSDAARTTLHGLPVTSSVRQT